MKEENLQQKEHNKEHNKEYNYVSAICGSGKSHRFINKINKGSDKKYIFACPNLNLADEIHSKVIDSKLLTSSNEHIDSIAKAIAISVKDESKENKPLVITHKGLGILATLVRDENYPELADALNDWTLIVDEVINPFIN